MDKQTFLEKIKLKNKENFVKYNYDLIPEIFIATDKIPIVCLEHGLFYQKVGAHIFGVGCRECGIKKYSTSKRKTTEEFIKISKAKYGDRFDYSNTVYVKGDIPVKLICTVHGEFDILPKYHLDLKHGCVACTSYFVKVNGSKKFFEDAVSVHGTRYDYSKVIFINWYTPVEIICPTHGTFWQVPCDHISKRIKCYTCAAMDHRLTQDEFIKKSIARHGDIYDYHKTIYKTSYDKVIITCRVHGDFLQKANGHLQGAGCTKCHIEKSRKTTEEFISLAKQKHGDKYDYSKVVYITSKTKVEIICPTHGTFWQDPNSHIFSRSGCKFCLESKGESAVEVFLKKYNFNYIREYRIKPYLYRYDFYLPDFNIFIEFNGLQHYKPVDMFGGEEAFKKVKINDKRKRIIVKENNGSLIVMTYLNLKDNSLENDLIRSFKRINKHWFNIDGKIYAYKNYMSLYEPFSIPLNINITDIISEIKKKNKSVNVLF